MIPACRAKRSGGGRKKVGLYCCGPTVYDFAHIGNWRTFVFGDLVRRTLEFKGHAVTHVMNITDVEDKIIKRVRETKTSLREFTGQYEAAFLEDLKTLNCRLPHHTPHATEYIAEIISLIEKLVQRGIAYQAADGSVYFSIEKYRGCGCTYGQLLKLNFDEMQAGERVKSDEYAKESVADFALWKARVPEDGDVFWPSPFGEGRPGWHIECSAMSMKVLGESFDLHLGGEDLIFPHHEDEIAQSEGATGKPFVKYWLHGALLLVEGKKMSKSLGNFFTLRDLLAKGFTGREIRCLLLKRALPRDVQFHAGRLQGARPPGAIDECLGKLRLHSAQQLKKEKKMNKHSTIFTLRDLLAKVSPAAKSVICCLPRTTAKRSTSRSKACGRTHRLARIDECLGKLRELPEPLREPVIGRSACRIER